MKQVLEKAKAVRLLLLDVDGVMTSGNLLYSKDAIDYKAFNVHDGLGIKLLQKSGVRVGIITGCKSEIIKRRAHDLGIDPIYQGQDNKLLPYEEIKQKLQLTDAEIAYVGDDLPDLPLLRRVGLPLTVSNAPPLLQEQAAYVSLAAGGRGAVRELCELIMQAQGTYSGIIESYLQL
jgi:3-deoxy-D-manno-octulosonate 8-phosphate phosphatase (KDO 8-P phosphatase)